MYKNIYTGYITENKVRDIYILIILRIFNIMELTTNNTKYSIATIDTKRGRRRDKQIIYIDDPDNTNDHDEEQIYEQRITVPKKELLIPRDMNSSVFPLPTFEEDSSDSIYISGPRRSGKSTWIANFIREYHRKYPKNNVIILSACKDDPAFGQIPYLKRIDPDELIEDPLDLEELGKSLIIFDDYENFSKEVNEVVANLRNEILNNGRKLRISIIIAQHITFDYRRTRVQLFECESYVIFPKSGNINMLNRLFNTYLGLPKDKVKKIMEFPSRWVFIKKSYPKYAIHAKGIMLL